MPRIQIDKSFAYHKPSEEGKEKTKLIRETFSAVKEVIEDQCPNSREKSIALTNLETAAMWAIKSVVFNDENSEIDSLE